MAIDWSGRAYGAAKTIWVAEARMGELAFLENGRNRDQVAELLVEWIKRDKHLVVGLDFAFSFPAWFLKEQGYSSAHDLWSGAADVGEAWLAACDPPFWGRPGKANRDSRNPFRATEHVVEPLQGIRPKSTFQIGGAGAVGTGSIRGMPILRRLSAAGFSIWPFDPPGWPRVVEIYPRALTQRVRKSSHVDRVGYLTDHFGASSLLTRAASTEDAFDAAVSALVMSLHVSELAALPSPASGLALLEGEIWVPRGVSSVASPAATGDGSTTGAERW